MDQDRLHQLCLDALAHTLSRDPERASAALDEIGEHGDTADMYAACCGFAEVGRVALVKIYGDQAPATIQDGMWVMQELKPGALREDPPKAFASRFLIAYANKDAASTTALFAAAVKAGGEEYVDSVCALLIDVAGIAQLAADTAA